MVIHADNYNYTTPTEPTNEVLIVETIETKTRNGETMYTFYFSNKNILHTIVKGDVIEVYDENNNFMASAKSWVIDDADEFIPDVKILEKIHFENRGASDYDVWRGWFNASGTTVLSISAGVTITFDIINALITAKLLNEGFSVLSTVVSSFVGMILSSLTAPSVLRFKVQWNYNKYCSILVKERLVRTNSSGTPNTYGSAYHKWLESPWSYGTCEAECRILTQIYP